MSLAFMLVAPITSGLLYSWSSGMTIFPFDYHFTFFAFAAGQMAVLSLTLLAGCLYPNTAKIRVA